MLVVGCWVVEKDSVKVNYDLVDFGVNLVSCFCILFSYDICWIMKIYNELEV